MITMGTHMLAGVLDALTSSGMQYPRDISLICVGDTDLARHATPSISSLSWNLEEMGRVAACMLLDRLQDQHPAATPTTVYLPTKFTIRHSCARHDPDQS
jgi:LacI family transcriptional regulator